MAPSVHLFNAFPSQPICLSCNILLILKLVAGIKTKITYSKLDVYSLRMSWIDPGCLTDPCTTCPHSLPTSTDWNKHGVSTTVHTPLSITLLSRVLFVTNSTLKNVGDKYLLCVIIYVCFGGTADTFPVVKSKAFLVNTHKTYDCNVLISKCHGINVDMETASNGWAVYANQYG